jgi:hypothetical protein
MVAVVVRQRVRDADAGRFDPGPGALANEASADTPGHIDAFQDEARVRGPKRRLRSEHVHADGPPSHRDAGKPDIRTTVEDPRPHGATAIDGHQFPAPPDDFDAVVIPVEFQVLRVDPPCYCHRPTPVLPSHIRRVLDPVERSLDRPIAVVVPPRRDEEGPPVVLDSAPSVGTAFDRHAAEIVAVPRRIFDSAGAGRG